ncbi:MAG: hypothetical protein WBA54_05975 [Acidaminobacteraceae bacterium]
MKIVSDSSCDINKELDTLVKNGRISKYKGILANTLNIKALFYGSEAG